MNQGLFYPGFTLIKIIGCILAPRCLFIFAKMFNTTVLWTHIVCAQHVFFLRMPHALLVVLHINPQGANPRMWHTFIDEDAMRWVKGNLADIVWHWSWLSGIMWHSPDIVLTLVLTIWHCLTWYSDIIWQALLGLRNLRKGASTNPAPLASQMCQVEASWVNGFFKGLPLACSVYVDFSGWPVVAGCILWSTVYPGKRILAFKLGTTGRKSDLLGLLGGNKSS